MPDPLDTAAELLGKTYGGTLSYTMQGGTFMPGKPRDWNSNPETAGTCWDLTPDGTRALLLTRVQSAEAAKPDHEVVFLQNFFDYLRQRAPLGN